MAQIRFRIVRTIGGDCARAMWGLGLTSKLFIARSSVRNLP